MLIITHKPASFMSACCRIGALLGRCRRADGGAHTLRARHRRGVSDFRHALDFTADHARLGKAIGADLREGKRTLPLIAMLERVSPAEAERVRRRCAARALEATEIEDSAGSCWSTTASEYARARAHGFAQAAKADLEAFAPSEERETLSLVADFVVDRDR